MTFTKLLLICLTVLIYGFEKFDAELERARLDHETERLRLQAIWELKSALPPAADKPSVEIVPGEETRL